ncbi:MAG: hypothetical protein ACOC0X_07450 [Halobacteriota archaeon]
MVNLIAAVASVFIPGLGQVLKGEFGKFVGVWVLFAIAAALTITVLGAIVGIPMALVVYLAQIIDALLER